MSVSEPACAAECSWPRNSELILAEMRRLNLTVERLEARLELERERNESDHRAIRLEVSSVRDRAMDMSTRLKVFFGVLIAIGSAASSWVFSLIRSSP